MALDSMDESNDSMGHVIPVRIFLLLGVTALVLQAES